VTNIAVVGGGGLVGGGRIIWTPQASNRAAPVAHAHFRLGGLGSLRRARLATRYHLWPGKEPRRQNRGDRTVVHLSFETGEGEADRR
jgi:hypothetical protein